jgi:hypothetical protein
MLSQLMIEGVLTGTAAPVAPTALIPERGPGMPTTMVTERGPALPTTMITERGPALPTRLPRVARALQAGLALGLFSLTFALVDRSALWHRLSSLRLGWLAFGAALIAPQIWFCAMRWRLTARLLGVPLEAGRTTREYALSLFLNLLLPFGVIGDAIRVGRHARSLGQRAPGFEASGQAGLPPLTAAVHTALVERASGQLVVIGWAAAVAPLWLGHRGGWSIGLWLGGFVAGSLLLGRVSLRPLASARPIAALQRFGRSLWHGLLRARALPAQLALSTALVLSIVVQLNCALLALGMNLPLSAAGRIFPFLLLSMALPASFAGFGAREAAAAGLYHFAGMVEADGAAFALVFGFMSLTAALLAVLAMLSLRSCRR